MIIHAPNRSGGTVNPSPDLVPPPFLRQHRRQIELQQLTPQSAAAPPRSGCVTIIVEAVETWLWMSTKAGVMGRKLQAEARSPKPSSIQRPLRARFALIFSGFPDVTFTLLFCCPNFGCLNTTS
jgi:hypothetical protein